VKAVIREPIQTLPTDDFKPLKSISLENLKEKSNNQRPASPKNVADLRSALSSIVKTPSASASLPKPAPVQAPKPAPAPTPQPKVEEKPEPKVEPKTKEIPREELEKLLSL
jgi:hypothetical protein